LRGTCRCRDRGKLLIKPSKAAVKRIRQRLTAERARIAQQVATRQQEPPVSE
jgi:hypothetical protein